MPWGVPRLFIHEGYTTPATAGPSGHPCIGCSEAGFWDNGPFYRHLPSFTGFGIESTADKIGVGLGIVTAAGIAAHALATNIRKHKEIANEPEPESKS